MPRRDDLSLPCMGALSMKLGIHGGLRRTRQLLMYSLLGCEHSGKGYEMGLFY